MHHARATSRSCESAERGASLVEYALLLALIAIVTFSAVSFFGSQTGGGFTKSQSCIELAYDDTGSC